MGFNMAGWSPFTKVIDDKGIKKLSGEMNISENTIRKVIKSLSEESQEDDDFSYEDVKDALKDFQDETGNYDEVN